MSKVSKVRAAAGTYFRAYGVLFFAVLIAAIFKGGLEAKSPGLWTHADIVILQNGVWVGLMAVAWRWLNKNDPAYGRGSLSIKSPVIVASSVIPRSLS